MDSNQPRGFALALKVLGVQGVIAACAALLSLGLAGSDAAYACLFGGLVAIAPTLYFARRVFSRKPEESPAEVVGSVFRGEIGKIALTGVLFFFGVQLFAPQFLFLLMTFMACQFAYWVVAAIQS